LLTSQFSVTSRARDQLSSLDKRDRRAAETELKHVEIDPARVKTAGKALHADPTGVMYRLRAGRVRILVSVDEHDAVVVLGMGLRPS
jgi:mRNA-degrading endonuclease RelE of RelBE toxin-antitoxin system